MLSLDDVVIGLSQFSNQAKETPPPLHTHTHSPTPPPPQNVKLPREEDLWVEREEEERHGVVMFSNGAGRESRAQGVLIPARPSFAKWPGQ